MPHVEAERIVLIRTCYFIYLLILNLFEIVFDLSCASICAKLPRDSRHMLCAFVQICYHTQIHMVTSHIRVLIEMTIDLIESNEWLRLCLRPDYGA